jgi:hypothetical protein
MSDKLISVSRLRPVPPAGKCVVCNLTRARLGCDHCAMQPASSIAWLRRLPVSERTNAALDELSAL